MNGLAPRHCRHQVEVDCYFPGKDEREQKWGTRIDALDPRAKGPGLAVQALPHQ